jgi:lysylphosphatidylglycerol synthetase-like protein (DUF2156 family)
MKARTRRPTGVTAIGVLALLIGAIGVLGGAVLIPGAGSVLEALSVSAVIIGLMYLAAGYGLLRATKWAWALGVVVSVFALIRNAAEAVDGDLTYAIPGLVVAVIVIYYLNMPNTKDYLQRGQQVQSR